jgi:hypothetical protein
MLPGGRLLTFVAEVAKDVDRDAYIVCDEACGISAKLPRNCSIDLRLVVPGHERVEPLEERQEAGEKEGTVG